MILYTVTSIAIGFALALFLGNCLGMNPYSYYYWGIIACCALVWSCYILPTILSIFRRPEEWERGSIHGLPARRSITTGEVQWHNFGPEGWMTTTDALGDFLPENREPRTPREWSEHLRFTRANQKLPTQEELDRQFEACREEQRKFPSPGSTSKS